MEKENFYSIIDELSTYNFRSYFENIDWYKESMGSHAEIDSQKTESKNSSREEIMSQIDDLYKRKLKLFEKKFQSYKEIESKEPHLILVPSHPAEKFVYINNISWEKYDPATNPNELLKLCKELENKTFDEVFYQPVNKKFMDSLKEFILKKLESNELETTDEKQNEKESETKNENNKYKNEKKEEVKEEKKKNILTGALDVYFILNIYQGNFSSLSNFHSSCLTKNYPKYTEYFTNNFSLVDSILQKTLKTVFLQENDYSIYPIMRNWSITDVFNITKNLLFVENKGNYNMEKLSSVAVCNDSKYLYIALYGICGNI